VRGDGKQRKVIRKREEEGEETERERERERGELERKS